MYQYFLQVPFRNNLLLWYLNVNFLLDSIKLITNFKNPSSSPLQRLWSGHFNLENAHRDPPVVLKYHTGSRQGHMHLRGFVLHPMRCGHWRKLTNDREGIQCRNYDAAFRTILKMSKGFHRSQSNLPIYILILFSLLGSL